MKFRIIKYKFLPILFFLFNIESLAEETLDNNSKIKWQKLSNNKELFIEKSIKWIPLNKKELIIEYQKEHLKEKKSILKNNLINKYDY